MEVALNSLIPVYDKMNSAMSFGKDVEWRRIGLGKVLHDNARVLDAGCGPGVMTETAVKQSGRGSFVMMDALPSMLEAARRRVGDSQSGMVRGVFEKMPFKNDLFDAVVMGFSFRDARDMPQALAETARATAADGSLLIVDISKPDSLIPRLAIGFYWRVIVPLIAIAVARKYWRNYGVLKITYRKLPTNSKLVSLVGNYFEEVSYETKMMGGLIILVGKRPKKPRAGR